MPRHAPRRLPLSAGRSAQGDRPAESVDELKRQLDQMRQLAFRDQLTGLFSRHYLTDYLEHEIVRNSGLANTVLALCDIDDFKAINDVRGHQSGDIAIVCIADILDDLATGHPVIRWGGEELLLVLFSTTDQEALRLCDRMRTEVAEYRIDDGLGEFSCTLTFGLTSYDTSLSFDENFAQADRALYRGKEKGKNRCVFASDGRFSTETADAAAGRSGVSAAPSDEKRREEAC